MENYYNRIRCGDIKKRTNDFEGICRQCGYEICSGDEAVTVNANGFILHRDCWEDYASENSDEFLTDIQIA